MKQVLQVLVVSLSFAVIGVAGCALLQKQQSFDLSKCIPLLQLEPAIQASIISCMEQK